MTSSEEQVWRSFERLGLSHEDFKLYLGWVCSGVVGRKEAIRARSLEMFTRLAAALPVRDEVPSTVYRGFRFPRGSEAYRRSFLDQKLVLRPMPITSWSASRKEAEVYLMKTNNHDQVNLLAVARPKNVVIYLGPQVRKFIGGGRFLHLNDHEVVVRGTLIHELSSKNSIAL